MHLLASLACGSLHSSRSLLHSSRSLHSAVGRLVNRPARHSLLELFEDCPLQPPRLPLGHGIQVIGPLGLAPICDLSTHSKSALGEGLRGCTSNSARSNRDSFFCTEWPNERRRPQLALYHGLDESRPELLGGGMESRAGALTFIGPTPHPHRYSRHMALIPGPSRNSVDLQMVLYLQIDPTSDPNSRIKPSRGSKNGLQHHPPSDTLTSIGLTSRPHPRMHRST